MSAITVEQPLTKAENPTTQLANGAYSRKEEFSAALDSYIACYAAEQGTRLSVVGSSNNPYALTWLQSLRRFLKARQVSLFWNERAENGITYAGTRSRETARYSSLS